MDMKKVIRFAVYGALIAVILIMLLVTNSSGSGEDWALLSEQQFREKYPTFDYAEDYLVPAVTKLIKQSAIVGAIIGSACALLAWAFSDKN